LNEQTNEPSISLPIHPSIQLSELFVPVSTSSEVRLADPLASPALLAPLILRLSPSSWLIPRLVSLELIYRVSPYPGPFTHTDSATPRSKSQSELARFSDPDDKPEKRSPEINAAPATLTDRAVLLFV
jgi:hypothetical protein